MHIYRSKGNMHRIRLSKKYRSERLLQLPKSIRKNPFFPPDKSMPPPYNQRKNRNKRLASAARKSHFRIFIAFIPSLSPMNPFREEIRKAKREAPPPQPHTTPEETKFLLKCNNTQIHEKRTANPVFSDKETSQPTQAQIQGRSLQKRCEATHR